MQKRAILSILALLIAVAIASSALADTALTECGTLSTNDERYYLANDVNVSATCFSINAPNVVLDCANYEINYSQAGVGYGISATGQDNLTIGNCSIVNVAQTGAHGIRLDTINNAVIMNNTLLVDGDTSEGIYLANANKSMIAGNLINTTGSGASKYGIEIAGSANNTIQGNSIGTTGTGEYNGGVYIHDPSLQDSIIQNTIVAFGAGRSRGVSCFNTCNNLTMLNNSIQTRGVLGSTRNHGLIIQGAANGGLIAGNTIRVNGTYFDDAIVTNGLSINIGNFTIENNSIYAEGDGNHNKGMELWLTWGSTVRNNVVTTSCGGTDCDSIRLSWCSSYNQIYNNTLTMLLTGSTGSWGILLWVQGGSGCNDENGVSHNIVVNNRIGTDDMQTGIYLWQNASGNIIANNTIMTDTNTASIKFADQYWSNTNTFSGNTMYLNGSSSGIWLQGTYGVTGSDNVINGGPATTGIVYYWSNATLINTIINMTGKYLYTGAYDSNISMLNTTMTIDGVNIRVPSFNANRTATSSANVRMGTTSIFVNSAALPDLNVSTRITWKNVHMHVPVALYSPTEGGVLTTCPPEICTWSGYAGYVFTLDVAHFSNFTLQDSQPGNIPEFSTIALVAALALVLGGMAIRRRL
jgi:hypothetical protein